MKRFRVRAFGGVLVVLAMVSTATLVAQPASAAPSCPKLYSSAVTAQTNPWPAGTAGSFTVAFTNAAAASCSVQLGSIEIRVDPDFSGVGVGSITASGGKTWGVSSIVGNTVRVSASGGTSKLNSGESVSVMINATPAPCVSGTFPVTSSAWVATDFVNSTLSPTGPYPPTVTVAAGACALAFTSVPLAAQKGTNFTAQVEVEDGLGHRVAVSGVNITVAKNSQSTRPDGLIGSLSGNLAQTTDATGVATFGNLSIDVSATYTLKATSPGLTDDISDPFAIVDSLCAQGQICTTTYSQNNKVLQDVSVNNTADATVVLSLNVDVAPDCHDSFAHGPVAWTTDSLNATGSGTKLLVVRISKAYRQIVPDNGVSSYRPCVTGPAVGSFPFGTWNGGSPVITGDEATGLLPDCSSSIPYWCLSYTKGNKAGDVLEGILFPIGGVDPRGH